MGYVVNIRWKGLYFMWQDFKDFIMQGNVLDLAIGVIMGTAFTAIVTALVDYIITPIIAGVTGNASVGEITIAIGPAELGIGVFLQAIIDFLIIAVILFFIIRGVSIITSRFKSEEEEEEEPTAEEYLAEIRDILAENSEDSNKVDEVIENNDNSEHTYVE